MEMSSKINNILNNKKFKECIEKIKVNEEDRIFCKHNLQHFIDVARIAYIMVLEKKLTISKDIVYGAALLHDIGRFEQYDKGIPHEMASADIASGILEESGYCKNDIDIILEAILNHRSDETVCTNCFKDILYRSDKLSRACYECSAQKECNWKIEKRNLEIKY